jgi:peptide/nickel transport system permease protein
MRSLQSKSTKGKGLVTRSKNFWRVYQKNRAAKGGLTLLLVLLTLAIVAPVLTPFQPRRIVATRFIEPHIGDPHLLGTDNLGRDILSGMLYGSRTSFIVGFLAALTAVIVGTMMGSLSGFYGGYRDEILMRITELFQIVPRLFIAAVAVAIIGSSIWNLVWIIGLTSWPTTARLLRSEILSLRERSFVEAARGLGSSEVKVLFDEILPNAAHVVIVTGSFEVASAIILEAGLSFLGLGDANVASLGIMLYEAQPYLTSAWWMSIFPGLMIALAVLSLNLVGDGLNEALNPRLRER